MKTIQEIEDIIVSAVDNQRAKGIILYHNESWFYAHFNISKEACVLGCVLLEDQEFDILNSISSKVSGNEEILSLLSSKLECPKNLVALILDK